MKTLFSGLAFFMFTFLYLPAQSHHNANQHEELGKVNWYRNYDKAVVAAKQEKKDIVILFQEVPGCATCRNYGHKVLSHPLMVEGLENSFIPLAIFNNKGGHDKKILEKFHEPSWNNPVVRIVDPTGKNIVPRINGDYSAKTLCARMIDALNWRKKEIPEYLRLLELQLTSAQNNNLKEDYFSMYCFWSGEKQLGKLDGVLDVESGFVAHREVVKVTYNPDFISQTKLNSYAKKQGYRLEKKHAYTKSDKDVHYYLQHSNYKYLPLTELQKTKINSALGENKSGAPFLSPQQHKWLLALGHDAKKTILLDKKFETAWALKIAQTDR